MYYKGYYLEPYYEIFVGYTCVIRKNGSVVERIGYCSSEYTCLHHGKNWVDDQ